MRKRYWMTTIWRDGSYEMHVHLADPFDYLERQKRIHPDNPPFLINAARITRDQYLRAMQDIEEQ